MDKDELGTYGFGERAWPAFGISFHFKPGRVPYVVIKLGKWYWSSQR